MSRNRFTPRPDAIAVLGTEPLALDPKALRSFAAGDASAFLGMGFFEEEPDLYAMVGDRAVVPVMGFLMQRGFWWNTGYNLIERAFIQALNDDRAREVVLHIDSPGGFIAGLFDTVRRMRLAAEASGKRVVAVADERCYSAAYALACVADEIVVPSTAGCGSVGVIGTWVSWAEALKGEGVDVRVLTSGEEKTDGHPSLPITDEAVAREQARINALAEVFFAWVSERRGLSVDAIRALKGGIRLGSDAVTTGLADRLGTANEAIRGLLERRLVSTNPPPTQGASTADNGNENMSLSVILAALGATTVEAGLATAKANIETSNQLLAATGAKSADEAIGVVLAWKRDAENAAERAKADAAAAADAKVAERAALLAEGVKSLKLSPADAEQDGNPEGWTTTLSNAGLRAYLGRSGPVAPKAPSPPVKSKPTAAALNADQKAIAEQLGLDPVKYAEALALAAEAAAV